MKIRTVYITEDDEMFDTKKEAQEHLEELKRLDELEQYLRDRFVTDYEGIRGILITLSEDYDVVKRKK